MFFFSSACGSLQRQSTVAHRAFVSRLFLLLLGHFLSCFLVSLLCIKFETKEMTARDLGTKETSDARVTAALIYKISILSSAIGPSNE